MCINKSDPGEQIDTFEDVSVVGADGTLRTEHRAVRLDPVSRWLTVCPPPRNGGASSRRRRKVEASAMFRLLDYSSMKVVGARYVGHSYDVRAVKLDSAPEAFKEDFRRIARELAKEALTTLKLL